MNTPIISFTRDQIFFIGTCFLFTLNTTLVSYFHGDQPFDFSQWSAWAWIAYGMVSGFGFGIFLVNATRPQATEAHEPAPPPGDRGFRQT